MGIPTVHSDSNANCWVGIDVSKDWIDVVVLVEENRVEQFRCERSAGALAGLAKTLLPYGPQGIVLEATGGLEGVVIAALAGAGLRVMRMNPKRVRDFAGAHGLLAKTDALDAYVFGVVRDADAASLARLAGVRASAVGGVGGACAAAHRRAGHGAHAVAAGLGTGVAQECGARDRLLRKRNRAAGETVDGVGGRLGNLVRAGGVVAHRAGGGWENRVAIAGPVAGVGAREPPPDRGAGGGGSVRRRQREVARQALDPRRPRGGARDFIPGQLERGASRGRAAPVLSSPGGRGQAQTGGPDRGGAQTAAG